MFVPVFAVILGQIIGMRSTISMTPNILRVHIKDLGTIYASGKRENETSNLLDHLKNFYRIISQLVSIDVKIEEENMLLILTSLLPSYEHLVMTMLNEKDTLDTEDVKETL